MSPPHPSLKHLQQLQTQILAPLPPISTLASYLLHHGTDSVEHETHPEQQEPEPELKEPGPEKHEPGPEKHEPGPEKLEPEPEPQSELEIQRAKDKQLMCDLRKAHLNLLATFEKLKKGYSSRITVNINTEIMYLYF